MYCATIKCETSKESGYLKTGDLNNTLEQHPRVSYNIDQLGNTWNRITGRLHTPAIINLFGEGSFTYLPLHITVGEPTRHHQTWEQHFHDNKTDWSHLKLKFQENILPEQVTDTSTHLLTQTVTRAGFYNDGSMLRSAINTITIELKELRSMRVCTVVESSLRRDDYGKWAWDGYSAMNAACL